VGPPEIKIPIFGLVFFYFRLLEIICSTCKINNKTRGDKSREPRLGITRLMGLRSGSTKRDTRYWIEEPALIQERMTLASTSQMRPEMVKSNSSIKVKISEYTVNDIGRAIQDRIIVLPKTRT
jgi:hypothetical protein